eukprot:Phypoly_transcript_27136.p2 GENE.Phypoly_transcript_27136~~Phypoly_transcript_27136.p2  ORF type:complete len:107 (+),score=10.59 Phypoly_transcript_27136:41-322(+)
MDGLFTNVGTGIYTGYVTDSSGCTVSARIVAAGEPTSMKKINKGKKKKRRYAKKKKRNGSSFHQCGGWLRRLGDIYRMPRKRKRINSEKKCIH